MVKNINMPKLRGTDISTEDDSNTQNICVTCLTQAECEDVFILTFEDTCFNNIFKSCMGFKLSKDSELKYICLECIKTIISFYTFKQTALKSYEELCKKETNTEICTREKNNALENRSNITSNVEFISILNESNNTSAVEPDIKVEHTEEVKEEDVDVTLTQTDGDVDVDKTESDVTSNKTDSDVTLNRKGKINSKEKTVWQCPYCPLSISKDNPAEIKKHRYAEKIKRIKIYPCPVCKKKFTKSIINEHVLRHGKQKPSVCNICGKGVSSNQTLKQHMMLHQGKKYTCNICDRGFTQQFLLKEHMNIHERDKTFLCPTCGMSFLSPTSLRQHQYKHRKKSPEMKPEEFDGVIEFIRHICDFCGKNFSSTKTLAVHRATHNTKEYFECDMCGKKFAHRALLTSHIWLHTAEFRCLNCFKIYKKDDLKTHECNPPAEGEVFSDFLPNECRKCGEILQHGHVDRHMKGHDARECKVCGEKIFGARKFQFHINAHNLKCDLCDKGFAKKDSFILHIKNRVCERSKRFRK